MLVTHTVDNLYKFCTGTEWENILFVGKTLIWIIFISDIDECLMDTDNCDENAACANVIGNFECSCNDGYSGDGVSCIGE